MEIEVYQQDWMPGFAAFRDDGSIMEGTAHVGLNIGAMMAAVAVKDVAREDIPYIIAESIMHEVIHALEAWAKVDFNEDRIEEMLEKYKSKYMQENSVKDEEKQSEKLKPRWKCKECGIDVYMATLHCPNCYRGRYEEDYEDEDDE